MVVSTFLFTKPIQILHDYIRSTYLLLYIQENDTHGDIGGHLSGIGTSFDGDSSSSDSDSENEIATQHNQYHGSFRLQTMQTRVQVEVVFKYYFTPSTSGFV